MGTEQYIIELLYRRIQGPLPENEEAELQTWVAQHPAYNRLLESAMDDATLEAKLKAYNLVPDRHIQDDPVLWAEIRRSRRSHPGRVYGWSAAAAVVLVLLAFGLYFLPEHGLSGNGQQGLAAADILPGGNRAVLTLADGSTIDLDSMQTGIVIGNEAIQYSDGSALTVMQGGAEASQKEGNHAGNSLPEAVPLRLSTPKGGTYQVILSDGTKVWLNAASTLTYPSVFSGERREIELSGEGYFEVAEMDGRPFVVKSGRQEIMVLGTSFNVNAYTDNPETVTTLISGAVRVRSPASSKTDDMEGQLLKPSEQATLTANGRLLKQRVNVSAAIAWKQGRFSFENKSFRQVMAELARWYNIEIVYETKTVPSVEFFGDAVRNDNLSTILRLLESAKVTYRLEGRRLVITGR